MSAAERPPMSVPGRTREVLGMFLRLGLTSFGGPLAHLGYFREEFVRRRGWLDESGFAQLLSLWQALAGRRSVARALAGINAAVVGVLAAALYDPLWRDGIRSPPDLLVVALGLILMARLQRPALWVVAWCVAAALGLGALGC